MIARGGILEVYQGIVECLVYVCHSPFRRIKGRQKSALLWGYDRSRNEGEKSGRRILPRGNIQVITQMLALLSKLSAEK